MTLIRFLILFLMISLAYSVMKPEALNLRALRTGVSNWAASIASTPSRGKKRNSRQEILFGLDDEVHSASGHDDPDDIEFKPFLTLQDAAERFDDQVRHRGLDSFHLRDPRNLEDLCWERASLVYGCQEAGNRYEEQASRIGDMSLRLKIGSRVLEVLRRGCSLGLASSCGLLHGKGDEIDALIASINLQELCSRGARESCETLQKIVASGRREATRAPSSIGTPAVKGL
jgi:hypothetical protein